MKKIPCLFWRDFWNNRLLTRNVTPGCEWVLAGEGVATIKLDGTACLVKDATLYKRYDAKRNKIPPLGFMPAQPEPDPETDHWPGWVEVSTGPEDQWHREAWANELLAGPLLEGTYELVGPKVQGNPYGYTQHLLLGHRFVIRQADLPKRTFDTIRHWLASNGQEGIVFHHPDGRMAKIRRKDYGLSWPIRI